ncbi:MAG: hypothetical protein ABS944_02920 [Solibacillus sp.]|uniref:hypothetical protein n=1 Tax=Solibacillus sp. TaxID=1909654 RepID=UPI003314B6D4
MAKLVYAATHVMKDSEKRGLLVISPIVLGSVVYGTSVAVIVINNLLQIMF